MEGAEARTNVWAHGQQVLTRLPYPRFIGGADEGPVDTVDALIQVVWPHDGQGHPRVVTEAPLANVGVDLIRHPVLAPGDALSVGFGFDRPVWLLRALNNGYLEPVKVGEKVRTATPLAENVSWPRWVFNDVDVSAARNAANKYYFYLTVDGVEAHSNVWAHGVDARTYFPEKDALEGSCS